MYLSLFLFASLLLACFQVSEQQGWCTPAVEECFCDFDDPENPSVFCNNFVSSEELALVFSEVVFPDSAYTTGVSIYIASPGSPEISVGVLGDVKAKSYGMAGWSGRKFDMGIFEKSQETLAEFYLWGCQIDEIYFPDEFRHFHELPAINLTRSTNVIQMTNFASESLETIYLQQGGSITNWGQWDLPKLQEIVYLPSGVNLGGTLPELFTSNFFDLRSLSFEEPGLIVQRGSLRIPSENLEYLIMVDPSFAPGSLAVRSPDADIRVISHGVPVHETLLPIWHEAVAREPLETLLNGVGMITVLWEETEPIDCSCEMRWFLDHPELAEHVSMTCTSVIVHQPVNIQEAKPWDFPEC